MQRIKLGKTGFEISRIFYGGIVSTAGDYEGLTDDGTGQERSDRYVGWAVDHGVNYFDVAPIYGDAQEKLGNSLQPYRKNVYLACKTEKRDRASAEKAMLQSLKLLHTDYFDVYQLHSLESEEEVDRAFGPGGVMELLAEMKEKGIARKLGITAHSEAAALKAISLFDFDTVLFPFNWHMDLSRRMGRDLIQAAREKDMGVLCMKSMIERAFLPGERPDKKFPKSWCKPFDPDEEPDLLLAAVKYARSLGVDAIVPPGNEKHFMFAVENSDRIFEEPLNEAELELLRKRHEQVKAYPFF